MTAYIAPIVEGQTEADCIERLLQRVWNDLLGARLRLQVLPPSRGQRDALVNPNGAELTKKAEEAHAKVIRLLRRDPAGRGLLLLLLDAEGDCPATLAPRLLDLARKALPPDAVISCMLAKRMLENWIVAGASTLAGKNGLPDPLPARDQFEDRSGVAWLEEQLRRTKRERKYKKTVDVEVFVRAIDLQECRGNAPSFDKLCRDLGTLASTPNTDEPLPADDPGAG